MPKSLSFMLLSCALAACSQTHSNADPTTAPQCREYHSDGEACEGAWECQEELVGCAGTTLRQVRCADGQISVNSTFQDFAVPPPDPAMEPRDASGVPRDAQDADSGPTAVDAGVAIDAANTTDADPPNTETPDAATPSPDGAAGTCSPESEALCEALCNHWCGPFPVGDGPCVETCCAEAADCTPDEHEALNRCLGGCDGVVPCVWREQCMQPDFGVPCGSEHCNPRTETCVVCPRSETDAPSAFCATVEASELGWLPGRHEAISACAVLFPFASLGCDGDEDCTNGQRCQLTTGETTHSECTDEAWAPACVHDGCAAGEECRTLLALEPSLIETLGWTPQSCF